MAIKLNNRLKNFKRRFSIRFLINFITAVGIYTIALLAVYFVGREICSVIIWQSDSVLYRLLKLTDSVVFLIFIWSIGFIILFIIYWVKVIGYLEKIIQATETIYTSKDELIELPAELNEVEKQMNEIRFNLRKNERAAREAEQRKNDLVIYLAHDLKTPLTSVIGYLTLLRDEQQISEELRMKYLSISLDKAERLEDLINEFFEITRFNLTNLTLDISRVNLNRMMEQITYEFKPMFEEKHLKCSLKITSDINIRFDVNKMQRVFDNLIRNAINYSFENSTIEISVTQLEDSVQLSFHNQGNTIPKEKLNRIFEQFYRLDTSRTTKTGGAGLGLAIAKEIIELHKGTISAFSENEITRFEVMIPNSL
ncbi:HAMP domain-containing histidine kinase [Vallitalea guaymasensis]|uniref:histidine kinase n=1 Tax=Vallitalea guaymasensis TaxID=1185412 RepID=A0A8J8SEM2_9FIRM|nr:HAMP domain-containing histidine kinase [Vallitalea guaymasensis]